MFNKMPDEVTSYAQYIARIKALLLDDLIMAYPNVKIRETDAVWDALTKIHEYHDGEKFIFILNEWDYIYHQDFAADKDKAGFTDEEVNVLYQKYRNTESCPAVTREGLELWYDGYHTAGGQKL